MAHLSLHQPGVDERQSATVTVAVVSADLRHAHAQKCLEKIKRHTQDFDLWILDNNNSTSFNHSREINKVLKSANTDFVVLMDDDVFVEPDWLPDLLRAMNEKTGLVAPMHRDASGALSHSGVYLMGDDFGTHAHLVDVPDAPRVTQCLCGALLLIDRRKCGDLRFCEDFHKYWMDIDYSLQVWERGFQVVCTPDVTVTHVGGGTTTRESNKSRQYWNTELPIFVRHWVDSRRLARLARDIWSRHPFLKAQCEIPQRIRRITGGNHDCDPALFERELQACFELSAPHPLFRSLLLTGVRRQLRRYRERNDLLRLSVSERILTQLEGTVEVHSGPFPQIIDTRLGYNLVEYGKEFLGVPLELGPVDICNSESRELPGLLVAHSLLDLEALVEAHPLYVPAPARPSPKLIETRHGYNLVEFGNEFLGLPLELGVVDVVDSESRKLPGLLLADSLPVLRQLVDSHAGTPDVYAGAPVVPMFRRLLGAADRRSRYVARVCLQATGIELKRAG